MMGEINLNNPAFGNLLNNTMISSLHRSIMAMELDANIDAIILKGEKDFSLGTDYLCNFYTDLAHKGKENSPEVEQYLRSLYAMMYDISKLETPFIPLVNGRAYGSGANIAYLSHFGVANELASTRFAETSFGFIPTGGTSYLLSRLPGEMGLYLALTGTKLKGTDLEQLSIVNKSYEINESFIDEIECKLNERFEIYNTKIMHGDAWKESYEMMAAHQLFQGYEMSLEIANRVNLSKFWRERRENVKMTVADVLYNAHTEIYKHIHTYIHNTHIYIHIHTHTYVHTYM